MRTIDACGDKVVIELQQIGQLGGSFESTGRIYSANGLCPTINTMGGGDREPKILEPYIAAMRGRNPDNPTSRESGLATQQMLEIKEDGTSNTLTTVQKDNLVVEPQVLTPKRTEHGKAMRKAYESGEHQESRHTMTELEPREDGITNTLTTVQKDNLLVEPVGYYDDGEPIYSEADEWRMEQAQRDADAVSGYTGFRIRKLTPKECWRLMGFTDEDFEKARAALNNTFYKGKDRSSSQLYKQAGNSIVVKVLMAIKQKLLAKNRGDAT